MDYTPAAHEHTFSRHAKTVIVAGTEYERETLRRELAIPGVATKRHDANPEFFITSPGDSIGSRRFDEILIRETVYRAIMADPHMKAWYRESVETRLMPGSPTSIVNG